MSILDTLSNVQHTIGRYKWVLIALLFSIVAYLSYTSYNRYIKRAYNANHENKGIRGEDGADTKPATVMLFSASWCPHCVKFEPEWLALKDRYDGEIINNYDVIFVKYDCSDRDDPDAIAVQEKYSVSGYPTIKIKRDDEVIDFEGDRTEETLSKFLHTVL